MRNILFSVAAVVAVASPVAAGSLHGLTADNRLIAFDRRDPSLITKDLTITGLMGGDTLLGIDFRPATGELWGISSTRLYTIDVHTGAATDRTGGTPFALTGNSIGFDFNPLVDRIRVVGIDDQDLRLNPLTGGLAFVDGSLIYADGSDMRAVGSAYANNFAGTLTTTLYNIDAGANGWNLTLQSPPNSGTNTLVAEISGLVLPLDPDETKVGFDIIGTQQFGYLSLAEAAGGSAGSGGSYLYRLDLASGAATLEGMIGSGAPILDLAAPVPEAQALAPVMASLALAIGWQWRRRRGEQAES
ncbi:MAG: DUF4394 domain-containing protein [Verrucomicrobia bacterium]|nr:DUF4394 domain-containing protein [Verrucomicrobiota bacterium]